MVFFSYFYQGDVIHLHLQLQVSGVFKGQAIACVYPWSPLGILWTFYWHMFSIVRPPWNFLCLFLTLDFCPAWPCSWPCFSSLSSKETRGILTDTEHLRGLYWTRDGILIKNKQEVDIWGLFSKSLFWKWFKMSTWLGKLGRKNEKDATLILPLLFLPSDCLSLNYCWHVLTVSD